MKPGFEITCPLYHMGLDARKPVFGGLRTINLGTDQPVHSCSLTALLLLTYWKASYQNLLIAKIVLF